MLTTAVMLLVLLTTVLIGNPLSGHRLQAHAEGLGPFTWVDQAGESPNGDMNYHIMGSGMQGETYWVRVAKRRQVLAREIMRVGTEDFSKTGPLGKGRGIAWSASGDRCALACKGWFVDCYDLKKQKGNRFQKGLYLHTDLDELKAYHDSVVIFLGDNPSILKRK